MNPAMDPQEPASKGDIKNLERLIIDFRESVDREFKDVRATLARIETRLDTQAIRLDRQGALLQAGSRCRTRMNGWAERVDKILDREISELKIRIEKLEPRERPPEASGPPSS
jgi:hypothetical protein